MSCWSLIWDFGSVRSLFGTLMENQPINIHESLNIEEKHTNTASLITHCGVKL